MGFGDSSISKQYYLGPIDNENIYVVGHSLGGMLVPKIAELNPEVKGIVLRHIGEV